MRTFKPGEWYDVWNTSLRDDNGIKSSRLPKSIEPLRNFARVEGNKIKRIGEENSEK